MANTRKGEKETGWKCRHCRFFTPITKKTGKCIWPEVPADMDASKCAGGIFRPK
jgi:hypothetical protein